jgi:hypothetical protein
MKKQLPKYYKYFHLPIMIILTLIVAYSCTNPFAPKLATGSHEILTDQKTIDGVFENFRYAYIFKDTLVYGKLLSDNFTFTYHNYDKNVDVSWGRAEDMMTTLGLFNAAQSVNLIWNQVVIAIGDSSRMNITRGFTLNIIFDPTYSDEVVGRVNLTLVRAAPGSIWQIEKWIDESNY